MEACLSHIEARVARLRVKRCVTAVCEKQAFRVEVALHLLVQDIDPDWFDKWVGNLGSQIIKDIKVYTGGSLVHHYEFDADDHLP
jgi:hypothetical protein